MNKLVGGMCVTLGLTSWLNAQDAAPQAATLGTPRAASLGKPIAKSRSNFADLEPIQQAQSLDKKPVELPLPMPSAPNIPLTSSLPPMPELPPALTIPPVNSAQGNKATIPVSPTANSTIPSIPAIMPGAINSTPVNTIPSQVGSPSNPPINYVTQPSGQMIPYYPTAGMQVQNGTVIQNGSVIQNGAVPQNGMIGAPMVVGPTGIGGDFGTCVDAPCTTGGLLFGKDGSCFYASAEFLAYTTKGTRVPPLVTTGPASSLGILGQSGVSSLVSASQIDPTGRTGGKIGLGVWLGADKKCAIEVAFLMLNPSNRNVGFSSDGTTVLARPFFSANAGAETAEIVAAPGISSGSIGISSTSSFNSAEINFRKKLFEDCKYNIDWVIGFRHLNLDEGITVSERVSGLPGTANAGINGGIYDSFKTNNQFNGGQIGAILECHSGRWTFGFTPKLALGVTSSTTNIEGGLTQFGPVIAPVSTPGGLLALNSNIGSHSSTNFAAVGDLGFNIGYTITQHCKVFAGYNLIYWSNVQRPGDQIDRVIDETRVPILNNQAGLTPVGGRPVYLDKSSSYWAQGVTIGLVFTW
ncbi:BBP7 family outer membrane beta-barrel protein [Telmatocola sphagniphila]|uniref:BBP7 family outer membrane beta-barrel protein n=1 Tax=Telmatocola sphagniphila TaxID=1123043 RepID=A0A8E6EXM2_9BACT|nr:BBP7 family outer membrane beta-barrel protein [Telmatocola sphagniphila]QVL31778.1 BBP7 family outer membrane beta-barrel protein [Telmatocola sphagniphila]